MRSSRTRSPLFWASLFAIGGVYAILAPQYSLGLRSSPSAIHAMQYVDHALYFPFARIVIGPLWYAVELAPISIALAALRVKIAPTIAILLVYGITMLLIDHWVVRVWPVIAGGILPLFVSVGLQLALWGLLRLAFFARVPISLTQK